MRVLRAWLLPLASVLSVLPGCGRPTTDMLLEFPADAPELELARVDPATGAWESAPWEDAAWLPYPGDTQVQVEHGLGRTPVAVLVYLSFQEIPIDHREDRPDTPPGMAAGDLARIVEVTPTTVTVWNDTSAGYFARIVVF